MNKITYFLIFAVGMVVGSTVTWRHAKKKYEQIAQEEIDSVKNVFSKREKKFVAEKDAVTIAEVTEGDILEYKEKLKNEGYVNYSDTSMDKNEKTVSSCKPYVIPPDEFDSHEGYDTISLTYYTDDVLADDNDEIIEDVEDTVGYDSLNHFGEYEDDSVFVRNEQRKIDYEILLDQREYSTVLESKPYLYAEE